VRRDELLLLADGVEEAERVHAEAEHADRGDHEQPERGAGGDLGALARAGRGEDQKRQQQPGGDLHADAGRERERSRAEAWAGAGGQGERGCEREQQQRVVVGTADGEHEQHRVEPDERRGEPGGMTEARGSAHDQGDGGEARGDGDHFERPQAAGEPERRDRVAGERERRPVRGVLKRPADEGEDGVARRFGRDMGIRVEPVQHADAGEREIAEDVLGDQRRAEQQRQVSEHDRGQQRRQRQRSRGREHEQVACAHRQHQNLKAAAREPDSEAPEWPGQPRRPAAFAGRDVLRGAARRAGRDEQHAGDDPDQAERAQRARERRGDPGALRAAGAGGCIRRHAQACCRGRGLHSCIVASARRAGVVYPLCKCPTWSLACGHSHACRGMPTSPVQACARPPALGRASSPLCDAVTANVPRHGLLARGAS